MNCPNEQCYAHYGGNGKLLVVDEKEGTYLCLTCKKAWLIKEGKLSVATMSTSIKGSGTETENVERTKSA
jgi:hypothetical protein